MTSSSLAWSFASSIALILAGIALINGEDQSRQISVVITPQNETVYPGTDVTITCRVQMTEGVTESTLVRIRKVVNTGDRSNIPIEPIATITTIENPYKNLGRFAITRTTEHSDLVYTLTISGVKPEDSGSYSCYCDATNTYSLALLRVYRPPSGISFPGFNDSTVVELTEGEVPQNLRCLVTHVMPEADLELKVDGRDITSDSLTETSTNAMCSNIGFVGKTCPLHQTYNMTIIPREYRPVYTDDGKIMTCTSRMRDFDRTVNTNTVYLSVRYAPKISCSPVTVRVNSTNVVITCKVYANPFIPYNRTWIVTMGTKNVTMRFNNETNGQFELHEMMDRSANPKRADVMLHIVPMVSASHFKHKYYLQLSNEVGQEEVQVKFEQLTASPPGPSGSAVKVISGWASLIMITSSSLLFFRRLL